MKAKKGIVLAAVLGMLVFCTGIAWGDPVVGNQPIDEPDGGYGRVDTFVRGNWDGTTFGADTNGLWLKIPNEARTNLYKDVWLHLAIVDPATYTGLDWPVGNLIGIKLPDSRLPSVTAPAGSTVADTGASIVRRDGYSDDTSNDYRTWDYYHTWRITPQPEVEYINLNPLWNYLTTHHVTSTGATVRLSEIEVQTACYNIIPEPSTILLLGMGLAGAATARRRTRR